MGAFASVIFSKLFREAFTVLIYLRSLDINGVKVYEILHRMVLIWTGK